MKQRRVFIKDRNNRPTPYYLAGRPFQKLSAKAFPRLIFQTEENNKNVYTKFTLAAVTADFLYYSAYYSVVGEVDEVNSVVMLNTKMELVSDNFLAYNDLCILVESYNGILWMSKAVKYWQRQVVNDHKVSPQIAALLKNIDIEQLNEQEKRVFLAFKQNGPIKYSRTLALIAVAAQDWPDVEFSSLIAEIRNLIL